MKCVEQGQVCEVPACPPGAGRSRLRDRPLHLYQALEGLGAGAETRASEDGTDAPRDVGGWQGPPWEPPLCTSRDPSFPAMWDVFRADAVAWTAVGGWAVEGVRKASSLP